MNKKFAIQNIRTSSWIDLDYHTGDEVIYVKNFLTALKFDTKEEAKDFCFRHKLDLGNHELFQLEVFASPKRWV